jgi:hypothetical protein
MRVIALIAGFLLLIAVQPTVAAAADAPAKKGESAPGTSVEMPYLIAPLSSGETLQAYAYISCRIIGSSQDAALEIRDKVPFIQDAFVRDVNAASIAKPDDPMSVDNTVLTSRLLALAKKVMGPGKVADLKLIQVQISPLTPKTDTANGPS